MYYKDKGIFLEEAIKIHENKYNYDSVILEKSYKKIKIFCNTCNDYFYQTPYQHIKNKNGCPTCNFKKLKENNTTSNDEFLRRMFVLYNDKLKFLEPYKGCAVKIKYRCLVCGAVHSQSPNVLYNGNGCLTCTRNKISEKKSSNTESFIEKAKIKHNNRYTYDKVKYINNRTPVIITCPIHGEFLQKPNSHLRGSRCPICFDIDRKEKLKIPWENQYSDRICLFYLIECWDENEKFLKVGVTIRNVKLRYNDKTAMPYNYNIIESIYGSSFFVREIEDFIVNNFKHYRCLKSFNGFTEIIKYDELGNILKYLNVVKILQ